MQKGTLFFVKYGHRSCTQFNQRRIFKESESHDPLPRSPLYAYTHIWVTIPESHYAQLDVPKAYMNELFLFC